MVGIRRRQRIDTGLQTGVIALDAFLPLGRGQSMMLQLPPGTTPANLQQYISHVIAAQRGSDVQCVLASPSSSSTSNFEKLFTELGDDVAAQVVTGLAESPQLGEAVLSLHAACGVAEAIRDAGKHALLLVDIEPLFRLWTQ
eukprot:1327356-Amphidinium_carterae.1